jgi:DNA-binding XRE family transcriptional regulator
LPTITGLGLKFEAALQSCNKSAAWSNFDANVNIGVDCYDFQVLSRSRPASIATAAGRDRMKRLDAAKLERLGRLVCGPLWQSELARTMGVSRQTVLRWAAGEFAPSPEHTAKAKELVRARIGELQRLLKEL